jgi:hypothetical protein
MTMKSGAEPIYEAANLFRGRCLKTDHSFLWPDARVWTLENMQRLWTRSWAIRIFPRRVFFVKWKIQLAGESEDVRRLAADLIALLPFSA